MSIELEVRSDDDYSRRVSRDDVAEFLRGAGAEPQSDQLFLYLKGKRRVEIELGRPPEEPPGLVSWIGFRVPAGARADSAEVSLRIAVSLAQRVGWRAYDPQRDDYVDPSELEPGPAFGERLAASLTEARALGWRQVVRMCPRTLWESRVLLGASVLVGILAAWVVNLIAGVAHLVLGYHTSWALFPSVVLLVATPLGIAGFLLALLGSVHQASGGTAARATSRRTP